MKMQPVTFRPAPGGSSIEMCGETALFPVDLPVLLGDRAAELPRLCRIEFSLADQPSASVYFAPLPPAEKCEQREGQPELLACALLVRYLDTRHELALEEVPRYVDCCFKDTCGFPIIHVSLIGQDVDGYDFRGVIHPRPGAAEKFAVRFSPDQLAQFWR